MENTIKEMVRFELCESGWSPVESESLGKSVMFNLPKCLMPRLYANCMEFSANCITDGDCTILQMAVMCIWQKDKDGNFLY